MKLSIIGTVGIPANYGGFETLVENLVKYHESTGSIDSITVYCSSKSYSAKSKLFLSARLKYIPVNANGAQSVLYDMIALFSAVWHRDQVILLLGVSGAIALPLVRLFSSARIVTNIDGIEWRRTKWQGVARRFLRLSEKVAVLFSHEVIADNIVIGDYVQQTYGVTCHVIPYGGDHATSVEPVSVNELALPDRYAFSVCRIEPENNIHLIVDAFSRQEAIALVMVGNWSSSEYGREIQNRSRGFGHIFLLNAIYDLGKLKTLRSHASFYVHGHSAGGTNPSLVEAMHFGKAIMAFDCGFNRATTGNKAMFFADDNTLLHLISNYDPCLATGIGRSLQVVAERCYTWNVVARQYFSLLRKF